MSHQRSRTSHFGWWLLSRLTGVFDHGRVGLFAMLPTAFGGQVACRLPLPYPGLGDRTTPAGSAPTEAPAHPRGPKSEGQLVSTELQTPGSDGVFARFAGHEQVVFCHDEPTGLSAIIAIYSTALGPALGGTRFYPYVTEQAALQDV